MRIVLVYAVVAVLYILLSDRLVTMIAPGVAEAQWLQSTKGILFVAVTSLMLYLLIRRHDKVQHRFTDQLDRLNQHQQMLLHELDHRVKNNLAGLAGLVGMCRESSPSVERFADQIYHKIQAMRTVHELIVDARGEPVELAEVIRRIARQFAAGPEDGVLRLQGPSLMLPRHAASCLVMVLHELFRNCHKHGVCAVADLPPDASVSIAWQTEPIDDTHRRLRLDWIEYLGRPCPPLHPPGLGMKLIEGFVRHELHGECCFDFTESGLHCHITGIVRHTNDTCSYSHATPQSGL